MKTLSIETAHWDDIQHLVKLEELCFQTDRFTAANYLSYLKKPNFLVLTAKSQQELVGSAVILFRKNSTIARLYSIAVHPDYQHLGIGHLLSQQIEKKIQERGCVEIRLEVREDNQQAQRFYLKNGYVPFGRYDDFFEDGAFALRMRKTLIQREIETS